MGPFRFQAGGRWMLPNLAPVSFVYYVVLYFVMDACLVLLC